MERVGRIKIEPRPHGQRLLRHSGPARGGRGGMRQGHYAINLFTVLRQNNSSTLPMRISAVDNPIHNPGAPSPK